MKFLLLPNYPIILFGLKESKIFLHNSEASFIPKSFLLLLKRGITHGEIYSCLSLSVTVLTTTLGNFIVGRASFKIYVKASNTKALTDYD
jgi:hypothetical protein